MNWSANKTLLAILGLLAALLLIFHIEKRPASPQTGKPMAYQFKWDWWKNLKNRWKHGIWFADAAQVWADPNRLINPAKTVDGEPRLTMIGRHGNRTIAIVHTLRGANIRIISARTARRNERRQYAGAHHGGGIRP